jgi:L-threonylcarbamoyladenylate synthase
MTKLLSEKQIAAGAAIVRAGGTVAFRTETVYGLGADATNADAVRKIFADKGRPAVNPLIVHFACVSDIFDFFQDIDDATKKVLRVAKGALTVIVSRGDKLPDVVSGGMPTVAVRVPSCRFARNFIRACGVPIAAPSANTSTRPSPTTWQAVHDDLDGRVDAIFMGRATRIGLESTVVKVDTDKILVLRLGGYNTKKLERVTGMKVEIAKNADAAASPGTRFKHYAPKCEFVCASVGTDIAARIKELPSGKRVAVLCMTQNKNLYGAKVFPLGRNAPAVRRNLFRAMRDAEKVADIIICETFPETAEFEAVNERVARAQQES